jgi:UDP-N-acetylmuramoyl-L-alanyl-D-glutamate--2,6-diaminopimelate ligase
LSALSGLSPVRGRFEILVGRDKIMAVVDYAHTPDALMNVLQTISELDRQGGRLITVIGAGGNRDRAKRPRMAQIAMNYSQLVVFTSDNPRDEDPEAIIDDMTEELGPDQQRNFIRISDRKEAIKSACKMAQPGDIILLAGKGHETYQEIKGERHPFDDLEIVKRHIL